MPDEFNPRDPGIRFPNTSGPGPITAGGFNFGRQRFGGIDGSTLNRLAGILGNIPNFFDQAGVRGNKVRMGDLRRLLGQQPDLFNQEDSVFIRNLFSGRENQGPGFSGPDDDGNFALGRNFNDTFDEDQLGQLQELLARRGKAVSNNARGGKINLGDLIRLQQVLGGTDDATFLGELIAQLRGGKRDRRNPPPAEPETPGDPALTNSAGSGGNTVGDGGGGAPPPLIPEELNSPLIDVLADILESPGFDADILADARNQIRGGSKIDLRDQTARANERFAARGLLSSGGSGLAERGIEGIENANLARRQGDLTGLDLQNALFANQSLGTALGGIFGLGNLNLGAQGLALDRELGLGGLELGGRSLDLQELQQLLDAQIQQLLVNLQLSGLLGFGGTGSAGGSSNILSGLFGSGGGGSPAF